MKNAFEYKSELAALREELAGLQSSCGIDRRHLDRMIDHGDELQQRLTAAEQRNAELNKLLRELRSVAHTKGGISLAAYIDPHIKPTESEAGE